MNYSFLGLTSVTGPFSVFQYSNIFPDTLPMEIFDDTDDDTTFDGGQSDSSSSTTTGMIEFGQFY